MGGSMAVTQAVVVAGLHETWYKHYPRSSFHFFNDNREWLQMDKFGHTYSVYQLSRIAKESFLWAGLTEKKSALWGSLYGLAAISTFEVMDGFSQAWGFSWGDMLANAAGAGIFIAQEWSIGEQRVVLKFSSSPTSLAKYRPNLLGSSFAERLLKDYNGQTYWLSFTPVCQDKKGVFPKWISISAGYSAYGMIGGTENYDNFCNGDPTCLQLERYRQYYLSLDIDWMRISTQKKGLKALFFILNAVKLPFPALEFSQNRLFFRPVVF